MQPIVRRKAVGVGAKTRGVESSGFVCATCSGHAVFGLVGVVARREKLIFEEQQLRRKCNYVDDTSCMYQLEQFESWVA